MKLIEPFRGKVVSADALRECLGIHFKKDTRPSSKTSSQQETVAGRDELLSRPKVTLGAGGVIAWFDVASIDKDANDRSKHSCRVIGRLLDLDFTEGEVFVLICGTQCAGFVPCQGPWRAPRPVTPLNTRR